MLTVLIPTYNRPNDLRVALRSVAASLGAETPVVIGDNGDATATRALLEEPEFVDRPWRHVVNPPGSTYVVNLRTLIQNCATKWLVILHDDDFFTGDVRALVQPYLEDDALEFLFSDHFVASSTGEILAKESDENSRHYGRAHLPDGVVQNLPRLVAELSVCLDGFFVTKTVAQAAAFPPGFRTFADNVWLFRLALRARKAVFLQSRLFAYRLSAQSLTTRGFDQMEVLRAVILMRNEVGHNPEAAAALDRRRQQSIRATIKWALKRGRPGAIWLAVKTWIFKK